MLLAEDLQMLNRRRQKSLYIVRLAMIMSCPACAWLVALIRNLSQKKRRVRSFELSRRVGGSRPIKQYANLYR